MVAQLGGGTPLQRSLQGIERSVTQPVPAVPPPTVTRPPDVWVPDRYVRDPVNNQSILLPGHWERRLPSGELYGPPTTICDSSGCYTIPAGPRPAPEGRQSP